MIMRLIELKNYVTQRFPDLEPSISSKVVGEDEVIHLDFKVNIGVNFPMDGVNEETIYEDVANTVRQGLYQLIMKSIPPEQAAAEVGQATLDEIQQMKESGELFHDPNAPEVPDPEYADTVVEIVEDEDRKVVLP